MQGWCGIDFREGLGPLEQVIKYPNIFKTPLCSWNLGELGIGKAKDQIRKLNLTFLLSFAKLLDFICLEFIS